MSRRKTIALLIDYLGGDYQNGLREGAEAAARERDANLLVVVGRSLNAPNPADAAQSQLYERLSARAVDGIIVGAGCIGIYAGPERLAELCQKYAPLPACSIGAELAGVSSLVINNRRGMRTIVSHLIEVHGATRIVHIRGPLGSEEAEQRLEGYRDALEAHGLPFLPELVEVGNFWIQSGEQAIERILVGGVAFDAVAAANDYMALGGINALRARGKRVPHDVLVAGFDDVPGARSAYPSLTTVRQPLRALGRRAFETLSRMIAGESSPARIELDVELVTRQSCGCAYRVRGASSANPGSDVPRDALRELVLRKGEIAELLEAGTHIPASAFGGWSTRLLNALADELGGREGRFLLELEDLLEQAQVQRSLIDEFNTVIGLLRARFRSAVMSALPKLTLDDIWHAALLLIGAAASRSEVRLRDASEQAQEELRAGVEQLSTAFDHEALVVALEEVLGAVRAGGSCLSLFDGEGQDRLRCLFARQAGGDVRVGETFDASELVPEHFWPVDRRFSYVLMPVTFGTEQLGVVTIEAGVAPSVYAMLREQIGAALKGAALHRAVVQETLLRERADRERLEKEALIAQQIQTAILPVEMKVKGLELAAKMVPAYEVGGDYYDVIPTRSGCWLGIGDVTGHGLLSGLVMLMIQSMVAGMIAANPEASPREIVVRLNAILLANVRGRLDRDEHATFNLIRFESDGRLTFAGYHEEIIICRKATGVCERIATEGLWVGAVAEIGHATVDMSAELSEGDLLVLFTDGLVEARNARQEHFGVERLCAMVERERERPVEQICAAVLEENARWASAQIDDVTLLVGRFSKRS